MKNPRLRAALALSVNTAVFFITLLCLAVLLFPEHPWDDEMKIFRYYTTLSNIFGGLAAIPAAFLAGRRLFSGHASDDRIPEFAPVTLIRYAATAALSVTLSVVVFFLGPLFGYGDMFTGVNFWFHLVTPVLSIVSFLFFESEEGLSMKALPAALVFTAVYAVLYIRQVVFVGEARGGWSDFYGFNIGGRWILSIVFIGAGAALLAFLLILLRNRIVRGRIKDPAN